MYLPKSFSALGFTYADLCDAANGDLDTWLTPQLSCLQIGLDEDWSDFSCMSHHIRSTTVEKWPPKCSSGARIFEIYIFTIVGSTHHSGNTYKMAILLLHQSTPHFGVSDGAVPKLEGFNIRI
jgi:hypothetical protein